MYVLVCEVYQFLWSRHEYYVILFYDCQKKSHFFCVIFYFIVVLLTIERIYRRKKTGISVLLSLFCFFIFVSFDLLSTKFSSKIATFLNFAILENKSGTEYKTNKPKRRSFWYFSIMKSTLGVGKKIKRKIPKQVRNDILVTGLLRASQWREHRKEIPLTPFIKVEYNKESFLRLLT